MDYHQRRFLFLFILLISITFNITSYTNAYGDDIDTDSVDILTVFSAKITDKNINLIWKIKNQSQIEYFEIEKSNSKDKAFHKFDNTVDKTDHIELSNDKTDATYSIADQPEIDGIYFYRIKAYNNSKKLLWTSEEIKVGISGIKDFKLHQNQPNPFNPITNISYELTSETHVRLKIFDLIGKDIVTLVDTRQGPGTYKVQFNASNYNNITSGIYFYKLDTEKHSDVKKMIISK